MTDPRPAPGRFRRLRWLAEWVLAWPWLALACALPGPAARVYARVLGHVVATLLVGERRRCLAHLRRGLGDVRSETELAALARAVFVHHALTFVEILRMTPAEVARVTVTGLEHLPVIRAASAGRGIIAVSGHLGNFEVLAPAIERFGQPATLLVRPLDNPWFEAMLARCRRRYGARTLPRTQEGLREALRRLDRNEAVLFAIDQNAAQGGVAIRAFGHPARAAPGAVELALWRGCAVVVGATHRCDAGGHHLEFGPPIELVRTGRRAADVATNLQRLVDGVERHILAHPAQYHWQHDRWRTPVEAPVHA